MKNARLPVKTIAALAIATLLSLYSALEIFDDYSERHKVERDAYAVGAQIQRFEALKRELPRDAMVGYISDLGAEAGILLAAQYALAPLLLVDNVPHEFVIGNFSKPQDYAEFGRARNLTLVKDFGNGVTLYRKAP